MSHLNDFTMVHVITKIRMSIMYAISRYLIEKTYQMPYQIDLDWTLGDVHVVVH